MELTDVAPLETWRELEQEIHKRSGMNASVFDADGYRITDFKNWANSLCPVIKADERGQNYICSLAHQNIAAQAAKTREAVIGTCDAGMMKVVVPIFIKEEFLGVAGGCGCLEQNEEIDTFLIHKTTGIDEDKLIGLSADLFTMTREQAESHARFIQNEINRIINAFEAKP